MLDNRPLAASCPHITPRDNLNDWDVLTGAKWLLPVEKNRTSSQEVLDINGLGSAYPVSYTHLTLPTKA